MTNDKCLCRGTCYASPEAIVRREVRPCSEETHLYDDGGFLCACAEKCPDDLSTLAGQSSGR